MAPKYPLFSTWAKVSVLQAEQTEVWRGKMVGSWRVLFFFCGTVLFDGNKRESSVWNGNSKICHNYLGAGIRQYMDCEIPTQSTEHLNSIVLGTYGDILYIEEKEGRILMSMGRHQKCCYPRCYGHRSLPEGVARGIIIPGWLRKRGSRLICIQLLHPRNPRSFPGSEKRE